MNDNTDNATERFCNEFVLELSDILTPAQLREVKNRLYIHLDGYDITTKKYEIINVQTEEAMDILKMFIVNKKVEGLSEKTLRYYNNELTKFIAAVNKPVGDIRANDIRLYIVKHAGQTSKGNQDNIRRIISSFFTWCTAEEYVNKDPSLAVKKIKTERRLRQPFSDIDVERIRNAAGNKREKAIIEVLLSTGCRIGEIAKMDRSDINGDQMIVFGKGSKERCVYLNAKAIVALDDYLKEREDDNNALFVSEQKPYRRLEISGYEIMLRRLGRELNIAGGVYPHRFRHTAATSALERGMPLEQVKEMLGHESIETTLIYAKTSKENLKAAHKKYVT